jgi:hypothetical protein
MWFTCPAGDPPGHDPRDPPREDRWPTPASRARTQRVQSRNGDMEISFGCYDLRDGTVTTIEGVADLKEVGALAGSC